MPSPTRCDVVASAVPTRASLRDLLTDLLGVDVRVEAGTTQQLVEGRPSYLATYRTDDGHVSTLGVSDGELSVALGAAIGMTPAEQARDEVAAAGGVLAGDLLDFLREVVNVTAKLLNGPTRPHVVLRELLPVPGEVPADLARVALQPAIRADYRVQVRGYGGGTLTFLKG